MLLPTPNYYGQSFLLTRELYPQADIRVVTNALLIKQMKDELFI